MMRNRAMAGGIALSRRWRSQPWSTRVNIFVCTSMAAVMLMLTHHATVMCVGALKLDTWRALTGAVSNIVRSWLGDSSLAEVMVIFVDRGLHLLQDMINGGQVAPGLCITQWGKAVLLHRVCLTVVTASCQSRDRLIRWNGGNRLSYQRQLKTLEFVKPLADVLVADWIEIAASHFTKEVVQSLIASFARLEVVKRSLCSRSVGVVGDGAIGGMLGSWMIVLGLVVLRRLVVRVVTLTRDHSLGVVVWSCRGMSVAIHRSES